MSFNTSPWFLGAIKTVLQRLIPELDKRYQSTLVSGTNIKTIDNQSVLGTGNIDLPVLHGTGWGVAKTGTVTVAVDGSVTNGGGSTVISISDLNLTSADDYDVAGFSIYDSAYISITNKTTSDFTLYVRKSQSPDTSAISSVQAYYIVFAKGYANVPIGGTTGQVLVKKSNDNGDYEWATVNGTTPIDPSDFLPASTVIPKANDGEGITMDTDGTMHVSGRLGQHADGGVYAPVDITPKSVGAGSFLVTEGSGVTLANKSLAVTCGSAIDCSMAANATSFNVANNYKNKILLTMLAANKAVVAIDEASAKTNYATVTSIIADGKNFDINDSSQTGQFTVYLDKPLGNTSALTKVRVYPALEGFSSVHGGAVCSRNGFGYSNVVGQQVCNSSNASAVFGNSNYNAGNSSLVAGRQHINSKQNATLLGQGHDSRNGSNDVTAVGKWSSITSTTAFAVGNGTSATQRKNSFEVDTNGNLYIWGTNSSGTATRFKIAVVNGNLTATAA